MQQLIKNLLHNSKLAGVVFYTFLIVFYISALSPSDVVKPKYLPQLFQDADKVVHFAAFSILGFFLAAHRKSLGIIKIFGLLFMVGLSIEILQYVMPFGRTFDVLDLLANSLGALFGSWMFYKISKTILK